MRSTQFTVTSAQVHRHATHRLQRHLRLRDQGPKCTRAVLYAVLFWAAARLASLAAACAALRDAPSDQAVFNALLATLPAFAELQRRLNRALADGVPKPLRCARGVHVALDLILIPYYGLPAESPEELYRGAAKDGTKTFHAYATAYVVFKGCRWTLGLRAVHHSDPWEAIVKDLLRQVRQAGVKVRLVLLDRGFYSIDVIRYLQAARYPFLMPVIKRGRRPDHPDGPSGTWAFSTWRRSGWSTYPLQSHDHKRRATVTICVCRFHRAEETASGRRRKKQGWQTWVYALWGLRPSRTSWVRETYRQRFGIESSYRQLHQGRIRTTTRSPLLRLLFVGLALVLRNVYVWLHWEVLAYPRRGRRVVDLTQRPLRALLHWLQEVAERLLGVNEEKHAQRPFPKVH
jgi:putative transposase